GLAQWMSRDLPQVKNLQVIAPPVKSTVYDVRGRVITEFFKENREVVPLRAVPRNLVNATLSTEDRHFYSHCGVDLGGVTRAGLPQNPSGHSPFRHPASALARRNQVLRNMLETKSITRAQYAEAVRTPMRLASARPIAGLAPYFSEMVRMYLDDKYGSNLVYE